MLWSVPIEVIIDMPLDILIALSLWLKLLRAALLLPSGCHARDSVTRSKFLVGPNRLRLFNGVGSHVIRVGVLFLPRCYVDYDVVVTDYVGVFTRPFKIDYYSTAVHYVRSKVFQVLEYCCGMFQQCNTGYAPFYDKHGMHGFIYLTCFTPT